MQNKNPHRILGDKNLEEAFIVVQLGIKYFHIFGFLMYMHVLVEKKTKLQSPREKGIFVGYNETLKAYMIFILAQRKTVVRRDVKFKDNLASIKSYEALRVIEDEEQEVSKDE